MVFEDTLETAGSEYTPTVCYKNTQTAMLSLWSLEFIKATFKTRSVPLTKHHASLLQ